MGLHGRGTSQGGLDMRISDIIKRVASSQGDNVLVWQADFSGENTLATQFKGWWDREYREGKYIGVDRLPWGLGQGWKARRGKIGSNAI